MSFSLLVGSLHYWNLTNIGIYPVIYEKNFWIYLRHSRDVSTWVPNNFELLVCLSVFLFGSLSYWNKTTIGISLVLEISFWIVLEAFLERFHNEVKYFWISCISVSLLVSLLPYWYYINIDISPILDEIFFWNFMEKIPGYFWTSFKFFCISCMSVSL